MKIRKYKKTQKLVKKALKLIEKVQIQVYTDQILIETGNGCLADMKQLLQEENNLNKMGKSKQCAEPKQSSCSSSSSLYNLCKKRCVNYNK